MKAESKVTRMVWYGIFVKFRVETKTSGGLLQVSRQPLVFASNSPSPMETQGYEVI